MKTAAELRGDLAALTTQRVADIERINREYDQRALELQREIEELDPPFNCVHCGGKYFHRQYCLTTRGEIAPKPAPRVRGRKPAARKLTVSGTDGWTEEDLAHYKELQMQRV